MGFFLFLGSGHCSVHSGRVPVRPGIGKARIGEKFLIRKALQKGDNVGLFRAAQRKAHHQRRLVRSVGKAAGIGIVVQHVGQSGDRAVVHVGRRQGHIAQAGGPETADIFRAQGKGGDAVAPRQHRVMQPGVTMLSVKLKPPWQ